MYIYTHREYLLVFIKNFYVDQSSSRTMNSNGKFWKTKLEIRQFYNNLSLFFVGETTAWTLLSYLIFSEQDIKSETYVE